MTADSRRARRARAHLLTAPQGPDRRTSVADCRIALCLVLGVPVDEIDPAQGYDLSERAYRSVRDRWLEEAAAQPENDWLHANYAKAREKWGRWRPELISDWPDWSDAIKKAGGC